MTLILVASLTLLFSFQSLFSKLYSTCSPADARTTPQVFNLIYSSIIALGSFAMGGFSCHPSGISLLLAMGCAVASLTYNISAIGAARTGPYPTLMISMLFGGIIVPMLADLVIFRGELTPIQYIGVAAMLVAMVLLTRTGKSDDRPKPGYYLYCLLLFLSNGVYSTLFAVQQRLLDGAERTDFIVSLFSMSALASLVILIIMHGKKLPHALAQTRRSGLCVVLSASASTLAQNLLLYCLTLTPPAVLYSIDNGGGLVLSILYSVIFFKEKVIPIRLLGFVIAAASIVILSI